MNYKLHVYSISEEDSIHLNKKVFRDPNAEKHYTLWGLVKKKGVEAGFFSLQTGAIYQSYCKDYSPIKMTKRLPLKLSVSRTHANSSFKHQVKH